MSKVFCAVCGSSYPDSDTQCPICGCVRPAEAVVTEEQRDSSGGYTYVKGGRFSKSNVKKRNQGKEMVYVSSANKGNDDEDAGQNPEKKKRLGLVIVLICLILIVAAMFIYIGHHFLSSGDGTEEPQTTTAPSTEISCTGLELIDAITMTKINEVYDLSVKVFPKGCTDELTFSENSNGKVITVDDKGKVTCVGNGTSVVTVICGAVKKECRVTVEIENIPEVMFNYSLTNPLVLTFEQEKQGFYARGDVDKKEIEWFSDDPTVATVDAEGMICAVQKGETIVHASYKNVELGSCKVICDFKDFEVDNSQEGGDGPADPPVDTPVDTEEYYFGSIYGAISAEGVDTYGTSLKVGDSVRFGLIHKSDRSKSIYFDWERVNPEDSDQSVVVSEDKKTIERVGDAEFSGSYCLFKATYEGKEYFLRVRQSA